MKRISVKQRKKIVKIISVVGASLLTSLAIVFFFINHAQFVNFFTRINCCRIFLIFLISLFIISNFAFSRKKFYDFLWRKRWWFASGIFVVSVVLGMSGSSMLVDNILIQPNSPINNSETITGISRNIRTDEYNVSLPYTMSQINSNQPFSIYNDVPRATNTNMLIVAGSAPVLDIVSIAKPSTWGYFFLGAERGFSFYWMSQIIGLFMVTLEFGMIITKRNRKLSVALAFLVTLAPAVSWWFMTGLLLFGELAVVLFYHYLDKKKSKITKFILATGLIIAMSSFALNVYPAWEIPLAFVFGLIAIIILVQKIRQKEVCKFDFLMLGYVILAVGLILWRFFTLIMPDMYLMIQTVYPGARFATGGTGGEYLFNYAFNLFYPYINISNPCEPSTFMSLFPIPIIFVTILIIYQLKKKQKLNALLCSLLILTLVFSCFVFIGFPDFLARITLLYNVPGERMAVIVAYLCVCLMIMTLAQKDVYIMKKKHLIIAICVSIIYALITLLITYRLNNEFRTYLIMAISVIFMAIFCFLFLISNKKRNKLFVSFVIIISIMSGATVNPIICGINVYTDKPLAIKAKEINDENPGKWIALNSVILQNYLVSQGIPTINSVNNYPNFDLLNKLDPEGKYNEIYNRYAHIVIKFTEEPTYFQLIQPDNYIIYLNPTDLQKIDAKYIISPDLLNTNRYQLNEKYQEDGVYIYEVVTK